MRSVRVGPNMGVCLVAMLMLALCVALVVPANAATLNNDNQLNNFQSTLVYRVFLATSPTAFDPDVFMDGLLTAYQGGFGVAQFPSLSTLRLRAWCGYPNTTYVATARYCATGAQLQSTYKYVFVEYTVSPVNVVVNDKSPGLYGGISLARLNAVGNNDQPHVVTSMDASTLLYNPDTFREDGFTFVDSVTQNTVVMWVIFAIVLALFVGLLIGCCCWCRRRDQAWGKKNREVVRSLFTGFRLRHVSEDTHRGDHGSAHRRDGGVGAGRYRDMSDVNSTAAHYNVYSPDLDGEDREVTSRASEFWPGVATSSTTKRAADQEMEERPYSTSRR